MIKAIPTIYNGQKYRSKLEAEYAKGMDEEGIKFLYEPEGFEFSDGTRYLPDFYLPDYDIFVEVKGVMSDFDEHKIMLMEDEARQRVIVLDGDYKEIVAPLKNVAIPYDEETNTLGYYGEGEHVLMFKRVIFEKIENDEFVIDGNLQNGDFKVISSYEKVWSAKIYVCPECNKLTLHTDCDAWTCCHCNYAHGDIGATCICELPYLRFRRSYIDYRNNT